MDATKSLTICALVRSSTRRSYRSSDQYMGRSWTSAAVMESFSAVDVSPRIVDIAEETFPRGRYVVASADTLPFSDESFEFLFMTDVIQYLPRYREALREARRVL